MREHPVTIHAVVRYLERVHGLTHLGDRYHCDRDRAEHGSAVLGLTVDDVRNLVCPPRLRPFLGLGDGFVRCGDRVLPIVDGVVTTCLPPLENPRKRQIRRQRKSAAALLIRNDDRHVGKLRNDLERAR